MRLVVCSTYDQHHNLCHEFPDDKVVVVGDALYGHCFTEIIDRTFGERTPAEVDRNKAWWEQARHRIEPPGDTG